MTGRVLVVGSANLDVVLRSARLPGPGETVLADDVRLGFGGKGANQAVAAAQAGAQVAMVGRVGDDPEGAAYRERLAGFGIDVQHLLPAPGARTGTAYVLVGADGENAIVVDRGANAALGVDDLAPVDGLGPGDVLLVQCEVSPEVVVATVSRGQAVGARVVLNLAPFVPLPAQVLARCDPVVVNVEEAGRLAELAAQPQDSSALRPVSLVVTRGPGGARWDDLEQPAQLVSPGDVLDTTGAGDAFCGALAAALAAGLDRAEALRRAVAAGADAVRRVGAQPDP
jgi:ribokinase